MTSNRGAGRVPQRAGVNFQLEQQYYQKKLDHSRPGEAVAPVTRTIESLLSFMLVSGNVPCPAS